MLCSDKLDIQVRLLCTEKLNCSSIADCLRCGVRTVRPGTLRNKWYQFSTIALTSVHSDMATLDQLYRWILLLNPTLSNFQAFKNNGNICGNNISPLPPHNETDSVTT